MDHLAESLRDKHLRPEDFSIRDLAETLVPDGHQWVRLLDPRAAGSVNVLEAGDGVDVTAFLNVTGQVIYSKIMEAYTQEAFVMSKLVDHVPTRLDGEKIPGVARIADQVDEVHPGMPYPHLGFGEDYIETPSTTKRGFIVPVTKEAIFFDRTHLVLVPGRGGRRDSWLEQRETAVGFVDRRDEHLQVARHGVQHVPSVDSVDQRDYLPTRWWIGRTSTPPSSCSPIFSTPTPANRFWSAPTPCWSCRPIGTRRIACSTPRKFTTRLPARRPTRSPPIRWAITTWSKAGWRIVALLASGVSASDAKKYWFIGDFRKAFAYMENWPITVTQSPPGSEADFNNDIVVRFKASERGAAAVMNPRYVVKSTG